MSLFEETEKYYQEQLQNKAQQKQKGYQEQLDNKTQEKANEFHSVNPIDNYERSLWQTDDRAAAYWEKEVSYQGQREDQIFGTNVQTQGSVDAHINAGAEAYAKSQGTLTSDGLQASAEVGGRAGIEVETNANVNSTAQVGDNTVEANAQGNARAAAEVSAQGAGELNATADNIGVKGEGDAFAGARASADGSADIGMNGEKFGEVGGQAEAWAGIGVKGTFDAGYNDGELSFNYGGGAALGVGTYMEGTVKFNPEAMSQTAINAVEDEVNYYVGDSLNEVNSYVDQVDSYVDNSWNQVDSYVDNSWNQVENQVDSYVDNSWNQVENQVDSYVNNATESATQKVEDIGDDVADVFGW